MTALFRSRLCAGSGCDAGARFADQVKSLELSPPKKTSAYRLCASATLATTTDRGNRRMRHSVARRVAVGRRKVRSPGERGLRAGGR